MHLKTRQFRDLLQENIQDVLDQEVPMDTCWVLYKTIIATNLQFLMGLVDLDKLEDVKLPLKGIGVWKINFRRPHPSQKPGKNKLVGRVKWVPSFRFSPSIRFKRILLKRFCGIELPIPVSEKRKQQRAAREARESQKSKG